MDDPGFIDFGLIENTTSNPVKNGTGCLLPVGLCDWDALGTSPSKIQQGFRATLAEVMDGGLEGEEEIRPSKMPRVAEPVPTQVPPGVPHEIPRGEPQNMKLDVKGMFRSSPIPVVANGFGRADEVQRAGARRGYPVMKSGTTYTVCLRGNESC